MNIFTTNAVSSNTQDQQKHQNLFTFLYEEFNKQKLLDKEESEKILMFIDFCRQYLTNNPPLTTFWSENCLGIQLQNNQKLYFVENKNENNKNTSFIPIQIISGPMNQGRTQYFYNPVTKEVIPTTNTSSTTTENIKGVKND